LDNDNRFIDRVDHAFVLIILFFLRNVVGHVEVAVLDSYVGGEGQVDDENEALENKLDIVVSHSVDPRTH